MSLCVSLTAVSRSEVSRWVRRAPTSLVTVCTSVRAELSEGPDRPRPSRINTAAAISSTARQLTASDAHSCEHLTVM